MHIDRENVPFTDDEIENRFDDVAQIGLTVEDLAFAPAGEMDDFRNARKNWSDRGIVVTDTDDVFHVAKAQATKRQPRRNVVIIKLGEHCAIYGLDQ